ncbi:MAG: cytochrome c oxidase subunit 2 [Gammaproteobacteria bacterium]|jgi:cytochrome c oxidase subunit 2
MFVKYLRNIMRGAVPAAALLWSTVTNADWTLNLREGVTPISHEIYDLHMLILYIVTVIGILVFGVMAWSIFHHRKSRGAVAANFHHSTAAEIAWTIIPILILVVIAVPATKTLVFMEQTGDADITLKVTGYQWKWKYDYIEDDLSFFSSLDKKSNEARVLDSGIDPATVENYLLEVDKPIVLPVDTKIRILTTANDVIHAWWVPDLGWKRDAVPGYINDNWAIIEEEGTYRGQCAELCGKDHGFMPIVLKAVSKEAYRTWIADTKQAQIDELNNSDREWAKDELMTKGEEVYNAACAACHMANGQGIPGAFPALDGSALATGPVADHMSIVLKGKAGSAMQAFGKQLSDAELAAVITYERNAWTNAVGDIVQPADIKAAR